LLQKVISEKSKEKLFSNLYENIYFYFSGVTTVEFADTFATKNDYTLNACALVGTSLGKTI
jgi:hypothetical protein